MAKPTALEIDIKAKDETGILKDKPWYQSKKMWIWTISFFTFGGLLGWGFQANADRWVLIALIGAMALVSGIGLLGQAFVDAAVRFARAWRGLGEHWAESKPSK